MAHPASRLRWLRGIVVAQLALLAIQFEFGENLSIAGAFPSVPPARFAAGASATYRSREVRAWSFTPSPDS
jgi:hypothetical protein